MVSSAGETEYFEYEFFDFLQHVKEKKMIDAVVISGGEPLIHSDLKDFLVKIKKNGFKIKLDTNGSFPDELVMLSREGLLDYVAMDIKTSLDKYSLVDIGDSKNTVSKVSKSINILLSGSLPYEFRTTCLPGIVNDADFIKIGEIVKGALKYSLQQFRPYITLDEKFKEVKPYQREDFYHFESILKKYVENVQIVGI
ncbi:anaerobic ribonucleoside-triphosphate reductase activating protein [Candidatus Omnitrophus magneticus]|uniref:Anaerobic ribonucleoside-triphosphate reductase activating protein n=1 Tax=Candidatus Omnitrophus magneticus TaxID=1609969 RepID=A0A0F0CW83_9BACT|nr:anaerobic ribonucleoside-triphosphate reductase activating protein [Candidatus Omnitrophus magneticus]